MIVVDFPGVQSIADVQMEAEAVGEVVEEEQETSSHRGGVEVHFLATEKGCVEVVASGREFHLLGYRENLLMNAVVLEGAGLRFLKRLNNVIRKENVKNNVLIKI